VNHSGVPHERPGNLRVQAGEDVKTATATTGPAAELRGAALLAGHPGRGAGRDELNFSTWDSDDGGADDAAEAVADGSMPPRRYVLVHPDAALSEEERQVLVAALEAMDRQRR
jgi:Haem-binding domain